MTLKLSALALATAGALTSIPAFAASTTTNTINLSAMVTGNCRFNTAGPTAVTIATGAGVIDPSAAGPATGTNTVAYRCTAGTAPGFAADNGLHFSGSRRVVNANSFMAYSLTLTGGGAGTGHWAGQDKLLTVVASIVAADYRNARAGVYADSVIVTINP